MCWKGLFFRTWARLIGKQAMSSYDHNQEINQAASQDKEENDQARGRLAGFLNDRCEVKCEGDGAVYDRSHDGPWLTEHDQPAKQQPRQYEEKPQ